MIKSTLSRRKFIKNSIIATAATPVLVNTSTLNTLSKINTPVTPATLAWIEKSNTPFSAGLTWGVPWPKGRLKADQKFHLSNTEGKNFFIQTWPLAYWPDGSLKWTGHAASGLPSDGSYAVVPGKKEIEGAILIVSNQADEIHINTGFIQCIIRKSGRVLIPEISRNGQIIASSGILTALLQDQPDDNYENPVHRDILSGEIENVVIEQSGPLRAVVKITGRHAADALKLLPFVVRLHFFAGTDEIRILHTLIYDANENEHFIKGLGLSFDVPLNDELHNRHIRFVSDEADGIFAEAVRGLTGLRRDPGALVIAAQLDGKATPPVAEFQNKVAEHLKYIPAFSDYTLFQGNSEGFTIKKRTAAGYGWISSALGKRALGTVYLGTPKGGVVAGIRNFWQSFPAQLDIRQAATAKGKLSLWLWAPEATAMDLRFYHNGMGEDNYEKQREALDITYEDYEPGFGTPNGVARTSEIMLKLTDHTPSREELLLIAQQIQQPAVLLTDHTYLKEQQVFGGNWSLPDRSVLAKVKIENELDQYFEYYQKQVEEHKWYGYWNYGDFMHTYDKDRHTWRYDVGGFGWDNSELSTDLWLWYYYLKTQRNDVFRIAEAMTRHTGEVDVHHIGRFAPLGSRHNVMHWGDSAKQLRISTAANRRFYYYLTADERVGDLLKEQVFAAKTLSRIQPWRKLDNIRNTKQPDYTENMIPASFGTDWGAIAAAWLTEWERTGNHEIRDRLINSMKTIAAQPHGFFTGEGTLHVDTGKFEIKTSKEFNVSHLNAVFGLTEISEELVALLDVPEFTAAWLQYCRLYNAPAEEQEKELGQSFAKLNLAQGHSRLTAFAAFKDQDPALAKRAWKEFYAGKAGIVPGKFKIRKITGTQVLYPVDENQEISTNAVAQWGLAAIQCLAYAGKAIPDHAE
ncbi:Tat pathway signal sequence domain protein [Pedobacter sp. L105]|uniref:exo-rhamnogalacturonan lyase family protein n=1 Tax=Pedobacter sp. L105 TaxID=1641871 RepID=UPI00131B9A93|nr:Tat pathway signal sequence domain protein [Pedobacter sp. L105]